MIQIKKLIRENDNTEPNRRSRYKFYKNPQESILQKLNTEAVNLIKAIESGEGKKIDNTYDNLISVYKYYFMIK